MPASSSNESSWALIVLALSGCDAEGNVPRKLSLAAQLTPITQSRRPERRCPEEMVDVAGRFCIDRYEATLVESKSGRAVSPYHHPGRTLALRDHRDWSHRAPRVGSQAARKIPLPPLPAWQRERDFAVTARSEAGRLPNAYLDLGSAKRACEGAGKRLCKREEWVMACRGDKATRHPYGERFVSGRCNVGRIHPAPLLHGAAWQGPLDPRLNLMHDGKRALLLETGSLPECASPWGADRIYDMVGNLDEWIDDPSGTFVGGFYARETAFGCDDRIEIHSADYYDYTLGTRCCR